MTKHTNIPRTIRVSDELWEKISIAARLDGRSISSWLRSRAEMALAKEIRRVVTSSIPVTTLAPIKPSAGGGGR